MSRSARTRRRQSRALLALLLAAGGSALAGLWLGVAFHWMMDTPLKHMAVLLAVAAAIVIAAFFVLRRRAGPSGPERDNGAATGAGLAIELALAAPHCAAAHAVSDIARAGLIDHLVATPVRLWIIAERRRRVPREQLPEVIAEIAGSTTAVRDWAPPGTPVRGCLVLGEESRLTRSQYDYGKGPVAVHTPASLARELEAEARLPPALDERVADAVRKLTPVSGWLAASTSPEPAARRGQAESAAIESSPAGGPVSPVKAASRG